LAKAHKVVRPKPEIFLAIAKVTVSGFEISPVKLSDEPDVPEIFIVIASPRMPTTGVEFG
jgi:hypothetical protein